MQIEAQHRQAERQIRADHVGQLREHRRQAYVEFATQAADHLKQLEAASQAFAADPYSEEEALALLPAEQQFTDPAYNSAYARLCMEGPEDVAYVAASIGGALADASGAGLAWALKHRGGTPTDCPDPQGALEAAISRGKQELQRFRILTMQIIRAYGDLPEPLEVANRFRTVLNDDQGDQAPHGSVPRPSEGAQG
ncbi:hypothetical protein C9J60_04120 [Streptomyces sp. A244]|nr:hypothetical protein C9J60_04120 [Streptomyces sp. A244]